MKLLVLSSVISLIFMFSCEGGGGHEPDPATEWYQKINETDNDNLKLNLYEKIIETDPQDAYAYYERAYVYRNMGKYEEAIQNFTRAIRVDDPDHPRTRREDIVYHRTKRHYENPYRRYSADPQTRHLETYCSRGDVYIILEKHYLAIEDYTKAIKINPLFAPAYNSRADVYLQLGMQDEAFRDYRTVVELSSEETIPEEILGNAYSKLGKDKEVVE